MRRFWDDAQLVEGYDDEYYGYALMGGTQLAFDREREAIWCGIAVGYEDPSKPVNRLVTDRAPPEEFATFFDAPRARL